MDNVGRFPSIHPVLAEQVSGYTTMRSGTGDLNLLMLLEQQSDNFAPIKAFITNIGITPATVFLPQSLKKIEAKLSSDDLFVSSCFNYLDMIKLYSLCIYDDGERFLSGITEQLIATRTVLSANKVLAKDNLDDYIFTDAKEGLEFFNNNKLLLAIYLYTLISFIFYSKK